MSQGPLYQDIIRHGQATEWPVVKIFGVLTADADVSANDFVVTHGSNRIATAVHASTGVYTVTLSETYSALLGMSVDVVNDGTFSIECTAHDVASAKTLTLKSYTRATDAAAQALVDLDGEVVFLELTLLQDSAE
jgi:hypothetical protein